MADQRRDPDQRPSPEALLEAARREESRVGKLRIFVGAAPGVGKTYEMLQQARARKKDGYDVVVGVVETHGRKETEALLEGLEVVPRRRIEYKGQWLEEMDLDAIIARRPQIVLVDELAHTNAPGSRHPKRYLDVEELLSHGIDVYTTVNIQHIESLNDVVAQITHVRVRETVPDSMFDRADAVELVDLTPDDLIQRLKEGKVYVPEAGRAGAGALLLARQPDGAARACAAPHRRAGRRATAHRRCRRAPSRGRGRPASASWSASARIRARPAWCATPSAWPTACMRPWTALYVESRRSLQLTEEQRDRIADTLRLAEALGGEAITIPSGDRRIADDVIGYRAGQQRHPDHHRQVDPLALVRDPARLGRARSGAPLRQYQRPCHRGRRACRASRSRRRRYAPPRRRRRSIRGPMPFALLAVAVALGVGEVIQPWLGIENVDLVFLTAVVGVAVRFGLWPSLFASVAASLCYNFFFLPPIYTFTIADPTNVAAFVFFIVVAILVSQCRRARAHAGGHRA